MAGIEFGKDDGKNRDRLEKWLKPRPREEVVSIANRVTMRSAVHLTRIPLEFSSYKWAEPLTISSLRCLLLSSLAGTWPSDDNRFQKAALSAHSALSALSARSAHSALSALPALSAALSAYSALSAHSADSARSADSAALSADSAAHSADSALSADSSLSALSAAAIWESVSRDIAFFENGGSAKDLLAQPLFITDGYDSHPDGYGWSSEDFEAIEKFGQITEYNFWARWLLQSDHGRKRSEREWQMLREIGLIDDAIWEAGAKAVAEKIAEIEAGYIKSEHPLAERIVFDHKVKKFDAIPLPFDPTNFYQTHLERIEDVLHDGLGSNALSEYDSAVVTLRRMLSKYQNNPQRIEMDCVSVRDELIAKIDSEAIPDNDAVRNLISATHEFALDIRAHIPEVAQARLKRAEQMGREIPDNLKPELVSIAELFDQITTGELEAIGADFRFVAETNTTIHNSVHNFPLIGDAIYRLSNRVPEIYLQVQNADIGTKVLNTFSEWEGYRGFLDTLEASGFYRTVVVLVAFGGLFSLLRGLIHWISIKSNHK